MDIKKFFSRKLFAYILAPILSSALIAVNHVFGDVLSGDQVNVIINKLIELAMVAIGIQGSVDAVNAYKGNGK
jgi:succinate dehydrogenase hydrophobic anchor subunit